MAPILRATNIHKTYVKHANRINVLRGLDFEVTEGEFVTALGVSGSGKSTMLHVLGLLDQADEGEIWFEDARIDHLPAKARDQMRNETFGFIFQFYHLLPELTLLENVLAPAMIRRSIWSWFKERTDVRKYASQLLERVGLSHRLSHKPRELSGGEMQRAAIARALLNRPRILLADEPTGNLDTANGKHVMDLLREFNRQENLTVVMVTHNMDLIHDTDRVVRVSDGKIETERNSQTPFASQASVA